jgi:putative DNA primase/helicase
MSVSMKEHALNYAANGWYVMPINPKNKTPLTAHGANDASNDLAIIRKWWDKWPNANVAIHTGKSRLVVLDVDPRNGGSESLAKLITIHGKEFLSKAEVITGGGGKHYYYSVNESEARQLPSSLGDGLDLLHGNKYVIAPPSIHASGKAYNWITSPFNSEEVLDDEL